jgi:Cdc6-like AAA superfamily ATPase
MAIRIVESPEPGSHEALEHDSVLAESDAARLLLHELRRYRDEMIRGRSFLIAGHRGSGKTTVVLDALHQVEQESWRDNLPRRPLLVMLHGPNLLPNIADEQPALVPTDPPSPAVRGHRSGENARQVDKRVVFGRTQNALIQITLGLYRAFAKELGSSFRRQVAGRAKQEGEVLGQRTAELLELSTQLDLELDDFPDPARLRELWRRGGFLKGGVLFHPESHPPPDQGFRELGALVSANKAYQRIEAELKSQQKESLGLKREQRLAVDVDGKGMDLWPPLLSLLTGGALGTGAYAFSDIGAVGAGAIAIAGALGAATVFKYSSSYVHQRAGSFEYTLVRNLTVETLDRVLPVLIDRLRQAGLVPVFVVDELDKVENLSRRISDLVRHLKKFVAEEAFFCFLTDRSYYEALHRREAETPYPIEYTYFTHRVFIALRPDDLHDYVRKVLKDPAKQPTPVPDDIEDYALLPYILLHRSQMHAIDLKRHLGFLRNPDDTVALPPGVVRTSLGYRFDVMIQLAIEMLLEQPDMRRRLDRQPEFRRLVYDALYFPSRSWAGGAKELDVSEEHIGTYLIQRMQAEREGVNGKHRPHLVSDVELTYLIQQVRALVDLLVKRQSYQELLARYGQERERSGQSLPTSVLGALPLERVLLEPLKSNRYRWLIDPAGRSLVSGIMPWQEAEAFVTGLATYLRNLSEGRLDFTVLSSELHIIGTSPAWSEVRAAMERLGRAHQVSSSAQAGGPRSGAQAATAEIQRDADTVREFSELVKRSGDVIERALYCGAAVGRASQTAATPHDRLLAGLRAMADRLGFVVANEAIVRERVEALSTLVAERFSEVGTPAPPLPLTLDSTVVWRESVNRATTKVLRLPPLDVKDLGATIDRAAHFWAERLLQGLPTQSTVAKPGLDDVLCAVAGAQLTTILKPKTSDMTLQNWGDALYWSVQSVAGVARDLDHCPAWLSVVALDHIGQTARGVLLTRTYEAISEWLLECQSDIPSDEPKLIEQRRFQIETTRAKQLIGEPTPGGPQRDVGEMVIILRRPESSLTAGWRQGIEGALSLTEDQLKHLESWTVKDYPWIRAGPLSFIVEWPASSERLAQLSENQVSSNRNSFIIASDRVPEPLPLPVVVAPKGIDDALARGRMAWSRPPWNAAKSPDEPAKESRGDTISRLVPRRKKKK